MPVETAEDSSSIVRAMGRVTGNLVTVTNLAAEGSDVENALAEFVKGSKKGISSIGSSGFAGIDVSEVRTAGSSIQRERQSSTIGGTSRP